MRKNKRESRGVWGAGVVAAAVACVAGQAVAAPPEQGEALVTLVEGGYPEFDIRFDASEQPTPAVRAALDAWRATPEHAAYAAAKAKLAGEITDLRISDHATLGTARFVQSTAMFLTPPSKTPPRDVARGWIAGHQGLLGVTLAQIDKSPMTADFVTHEGLMHHFTWQQTIGGIELYGCELRANVTGRGELINVGSTMIPTDGLDIPAGTLTDLDALRAAAANVGIAMTADPVPGEASGPDAKRTWERTADFGNQDPIESRRVYFARTRTQVVPAWYVVVPAPGIGHTYEMVVDATSGDVLWRWDRLKFDTTQPATYRVYTSDSPAPGSPGTPTPTGFQFPHVARQLVTVQPAEIAPYSPNGWIPDGQTATVGNNVDAYNDAANDNTASAADRATGVSRVFDFAANIGFQTGDAPSVYRDASTTQLFYLANRYHDRLFALGFDEAARNFQTTNFVTGTGADPVRAESQDGSGTNNANFSTSGTDGSGARCQMYIWTPPTPDRDGSFDGDIVDHELSHGLSIRLHRGGLTGTQGGGMGEGWGDFYGICLNAEPGDDFSAVYTTGAYATYALTGANNYYFGIRRFPYSVDMNKSPLTYADIDVLTYDASIPRNSIGSSTANEVHNVGEVWTQVLLECRNEIAQTEGYAANQIIMQLAVDGMKLAPSAPNFLNERDTIIAADNTRYGGAHYLAIWRAFAKRGMGVSASSPASGTAGIVEAYDLPIRVDFSYPSGTPSAFDPGVPTPITVTMNPILLTLTPGTQTLYYAINNGPFTGVPMTALGGNQFTASIPAQTCFTNIRYYVATDTSNGLYANPAGAPANAYAGQVMTLTLAATDNMETDQGWTVGPNTATTGLWNRMAPQQTVNGTTVVQPGEDHSATGTLCWVTDGNAGTSVGAFDVDGGYTRLTSPAYNLAGMQDAQITYWRWYSNGANGAQDDTFTVEVSVNNGSSWVTAETISTGAQAAGGWYQGSWKLSSLSLAPTAQVRVRFTAEDIGTGSLVEAAIDDLAIYAVTCENPPACDTDYNCTGQTDQDDVVALIMAIASGDYASVCLDPDFNHDGNVDQDDIASLINRVSGGDCP
jgi:hypothetical protein